jgi:hypothetical protein
MRMLRRTLAWLLAAALVLGPLGAGASALPAACAAEPATAAAPASGNCKNCGDQGKDTGCPPADCTATCVAGPAFAAPAALVQRAAEPAPAGALSPADAPAARAIPPDPPPPR